MKAILVIDVNDDINFEEARVNITMQEDSITHLIKGDEYSAKKWYDNVKLKPMPTKKSAVFDANCCDIEEEIKIIREIDGYNRCIDEMLGEEEWKQY